MRAGRAHECLSFAGADRHTPDTMHVVAAFDAGDRRDRTRSGYNEWVFRGHGTLATQAGARLVSQPPAPTGGHIRSRRWGIMHRLERPATSNEAGARFFRPRRSCETGGAPPTRVSVVACAVNGGRYGRPKRSSEGSVGRDRNGIIRRANSEARNCVLPSRQWRHARSPPISGRDMTPRRRPRTAL